jgi:hypothetical protein
METYRYDEDVDSWRGALEAMRPTAQRLLEVGLPPGSRRHRPFHWPLEFPEVFVNRNGFDAIVGNPPFIGGQRITGALGQPYRDYLVEYIAGGKRGSADYVAYFFLRAEGLLKSGGTAGLLATNTIAQGDTREVGLDQVTGRGATVYRAIPSRKWPGEANLEVAHVWFRRGPWAGPFLLDESTVGGITSQLQVPGTVRGRPFRLEANAAKAFKGIEIGGMGFVISQSEADAILATDPTSRTVLAPLLSGDDLNSTFDHSASRWIINFGERTLAEAEQYSTCIRIVRERVLPGIQARTQNSAKPDPRAARWWQFRRTSPEMQAAIKQNQQVLCIAETSRTLAPAFVPNAFVFSKTLIVFSFESAAHFALLMSSIHNCWILQYGSTMRTDERYIASDCFETFPFPSCLTSLEAIGECYHSHRRSLMTARRQGLTATYSLFHSPHEVSQDITTLRALHVEMDSAVASAYGWTDLDLGHGFHQTKQGVRYTISEVARRKVLDRLLATNHERYAAEQSAAAALPRPKTKARKRPPEQSGLF